MSVSLVLSFNATLLDYIMICNLNTFDNLLCCFLGFSRKRNTERSSSSNYGDETKVRSPLGFNRSENRDLAGGEHTAWVPAAPVVLLLIAIAISGATTVPDTDAVTDADPDAKAVPMTTDPLPLDDLLLAARGPPLQPWMLLGATSTLGTAERDTSPDPAGADTDTGAGTGTGTGDPTRDSGGGGDPSMVSVPFNDPDDDSDFACRLGQ